MKKSIPKNWVNFNDPTKKYFYQTKFQLLQTEITSTNFDKTNFKKFQWRSRKQDHRQSHWRRRNFTFLCDVESLFPSAPMCYAVEYLEDYLLSKGITGERLSTLVSLTDLCMYSTRIIFNSDQSFTNYLKVLQWETH